MAAGNVARVLRGPGRLVVNPTDLTTSYPYGGTEIGWANSVALTPIGQPFLVTAEALGGEVTDVLHGDNRHVLNCFLRGWDDDAIELMFPDAYTVGSTTRHAVYSVPGDHRAGESMIADTSLIILYVPDDAIHVPALIVYRGVPDWSPDSQLAWQTRTEMGIPLTVYCLEDDEGNFLRIGRFADLDLV